MKKIILNLAVACILLVPLATMVGINYASAQAAVGGQPVGAPYQVGTQVNICCGADSIINIIINWLFSILLFAAAVFIIIAAFDFVTAQGDAEKVKTARNFVMYALIGVVVAFIAKGLVFFAANIAGANITPQ